MEIYVFDGNYELKKALGVIDDFISLIWTDRHIQRGDFKFTVKDTSTNRSLLKMENLLQIEQSEFTMIVEAVQRSKGVLTVSGRDLGSMLDRRIVLQTYLSRPPKLTDYIHQLVADNIGLFALLPERSIPYLNCWFNIPSGFKKQTGYEQTEYGQNLLEAITELCEDVDLGFRLDLEDPRFGFWLYAGVDRTVTKKPIIMRPQDEAVKDFTVVTGNATEKNVAFVNLPPAAGGGGIGEVRKVVRADGVWNQNQPRREIWTDANQLRQDPLFNGRSKAEMMKTWGRKLLAKNKRVHGMDFQINPATVYKYRRDYYMGDLLGILEEGGTKPVRYQVSEYIHSFAKGAYEGYPTLTLYEENR